MLKRYFFPLLLVLLLGASAVYWFAVRITPPRDVREAVPVEHFTLRNGLQVVVMPNDRIPVVTHLLVVKAGGADDPGGKSGLAHYLEHLMFTGTPNFPEGVYEHTIARVGGTQNAMTTRDFTLYYATLPAKELPALMAMEADRLLHLSFDADRAARELKVITEERNMRVDNSPTAQFGEEIDALTFLNHPYHAPLIGWPTDMASFTPEDASGFFAEHYRASNLILVVAGDITAKEVRRYAERYYGVLPASPAPERHWASEPPMRSSKHAEMRDARVNEPRVIRQYTAPSVGAGDKAATFPLAVFTQMLGGGDVSLLYDALVREQKLATNISAEYDPLMLGPAVLRIEATPAPGVSLSTLEHALDAKLAAILAAPLEPAAVTRAKTRLKAETIFAQDGLQPLARLIATLYAKGLDEHYFYQWEAAIEAVTPEQAQAAARTVLLPGRAVTGYLLPEEKPAEKAGL